MMEEFEHDEQHRPAPPLREQVLVGAKVFGIMSAVFYVIWWLDAAVSR